MHLLEVISHIIRYVRSATIMHTKIMDLPDGETI